MRLLRSRTVMVGAAAVLLIAIVGGGWLAFGGSPQAPQPQPDPVSQPHAVATANSQPDAA